MAHCMSDETSTFCFCHIMLGVYTQYCKSSAQRLMVCLHHAEVVPTVYCICGCMLSMQVAFKGLRATMCSFCACSLCPTPCLTTAQGRCCSYCLLPQLQQWSLPCCSCSCRHCCSSTAHARRNCSSQPQVGAMLNNWHHCTYTQRHLM
jgi:hypothetical protein